MIQKTINLFTRKFKQVMKVVFEKHEAEEMFHDALCNGLHYIESYGLTLKIKKKDYEQAKESLRELKKKEVLEDFENTFIKYHKMSKDDYASFILSNKSILENSESVRDIIENYYEDSHNDLLTDYLIKLYSKIDISRSVCYEDYLMQILKDGNKLKLVDDEGGEDSWSITLEDVHERMSNVDFRHLVDMSQGNDDAITADVILQTIFIQEIMFG